MADWKSRSWRKASARRSSSSARATDSPQPTPAQPGAARTTPHQRGERPAALLLLKPRRLMNVNGLSVASAAEIYSLRPEDIYLVHDDLDKALGKVAIKLGGSARGHNGVRSCISALQSNEMTRVRVGIGRPEGEMTVSSYVLAPFSAGEQERLEQVLAQAATCLLEHILQRRAPVGEPGDRG
ncbi:PREDICTED: probable peptidyl-tRNA hydrolase [Nipponia nippon]|uniref:probable peptidyl-tRNA hydrolase n=1 Tax=Nipponia nippon TaxID=128390 RepID=UPI0005118C28|nr:PREDICTED: probable peptidyl-tRNA hydrolase [Nipponia nippon]